MSDDVARLLEAARKEMEQSLKDGPKPVRWTGYVVHAMGNQIWLAPAGNPDEQSKSRH